VYRLFFIPSPPVQITRELQFSLAELFGGRSPLDLAEERSSKCPLPFWWTPDECV
jgi:hypothetical protein